MEQNGVNDSRFHMWRAIFALAHADGKVTVEETAFINNYLQHVPFSGAQRLTIEQDIANPQQIGEMLARVTEPEDQGQFFQFADMLVRCDGDYDPYEQSAIERSLGDQLRKFNLPHMEAQLKSWKESASLQRKAANESIEKEAEKTVGLGAMIGQMVKFGKKSRR